MNASKPEHYWAQLNANRQATEADAHAHAVNQARHLMDVLDAVRPARNLVYRDERAMGEAVAEIRTHGPQPPLDYAAREPLNPETQAFSWFHPVLIPAAFLAGLILGLGF